MQTIAQPKHHHFKGLSSYSPPNITKGGPHALKGKDHSGHLTLQFIGIRKPRNEHVIGYPLGKKSNITSLVVKSGLTGNSTISELKKFIKTTYSIPMGYDLFILYSHIVISQNDNAILNDYGITNQSLLTLSIIKTHPSKCPNAQTPHSAHHHISRSLSCTEKTMKKGSDIGLDIITQETGVDLYRMPVCGHLMSRESLFHFANSRVEDPSSLYLECPHSKPITKEDMSVLWESPRITVQMVSQFMEHLPLKFKQKIWMRHCTQYGSPKGIYGKRIEPKEILFTLRSFVALFIRLNDRKTGMLQQQVVMCLVTRVFVVVSH